MLKSSTTYLVQGISGRGLDYEHWPVCTFDDEKEADDYAEKATVKAKEFIERYHNRSPGSTIKCWWCGWDDGENEYDEKGRQVNYDQNLVKYQVVELTHKYYE